MAYETCFVMMPFTEHFRGYYEKIFTEAIRDIGLSPIKVDDIYTATQISDDIFKLIQQASIILADATGKNPNVNYELGIAHALGKKAVIITQKEEDVPFDYRHMRHIVYETSKAGWEAKLKQDIGNALRATLNVNSPDTFIAGQNLTNLISFLEDTALDSSYELRKEAFYQSDENGNCIVRQSWTITARTQISHIIHGVVLDEPGSIRFHRIYDRTNAVNLHAVTTLAHNDWLRKVILLYDILRPKEILQIDLEYTADNYLNHLFSKGRETMSHSANMKRNVLYTRRTDHYFLPLNEGTRNFTIELNGSSSIERADKEIRDNTLILSVDMQWNEPYAGNYSYEIVGNLRR